MSSGAWPRALCLLETAGRHAELLRYTFHPHGGTDDAARQLGLDGHRVIKTLVFDNNGNDGTLRAVLALTHGDEKISLRKLERLSGLRRLFPSAPAVAEALTGMQVGGICPFGLKNPLPVFAQQSMRLLDLLYINAGQRGMILRISPDALALAEVRYGDLRSMADREPASPQCI